LPIGLIGILALVGCQSTEVSPSPSAAESAAESETPSAAESETASASPSGGEGEETSVFDLEVGDCFGSAADALEAVEVVDCADTHIYEVFALLDHEAGEDEAYPGDEEIGEYGDEACREPFTDYVGHDYETSVYWITTVTPSAETWAEGDREVVCTLRRGQEGEETTGSAEGTNQ
jgi:hypothetical protein